MWFLSEKINNIIYFGILIFSALLLVWGNLFITLSAYFLLAFWILEGNYKHKLRQLISSKPALFFLAIFSVILIWSLSQITHEVARKELWQTTPLFVYAFVIGSKKPLSQVQFKSILLVFLFSITVNSIFNYLQFHTFYNDYADIRKVSFFMSYIRLALYSILGIVICGYYLYFSPNQIHSKKQGLILLGCFIWLIYFVLYLGSITGYILLFTLLGITALTYTFKHKEKYIKYASLALIIIAFSYVCTVMYEELQLFIHPDTIEVSEIDTHTQLGNSYKPFSKQGIIENGHWVNLYMCKKELKKNWHTYSSIPLHKHDKKNQPIISTLIRYMTSKNLRKDSSGLAQLTKKDIQNIENGCTNYRFTNNNSFRNRIYETIWEFHYYLQGNSPAGHTVTQRFEFIKCAFEVIQKHPVWGTGPAHAITELHAQYPQQTYHLPQQYWHKPHNQFILFVLLYGIVGASIIFISLTALFYLSFRSQHTLAISWAIITIIAFLNEDMLDSINGLVFFSFFGCLFLCGNKSITQKK
ncbi:MAG: O-antigen ligase family protein [Bacteroidales bacterium]